MASRLHCSCAAVLVLVCSSALVSVCSAQAPAAQLGAQSAFVGVLTPPAPAGPPNATLTAPCQGTSAAKLVINDVVPVAAAGIPQSILIRNAGGKTANITGYTLSGTNTNKSDPAAKVLAIPSRVQCEDNTTILPGDELTFTPYDEVNNPCGFQFTLDPTGSVQLSDAVGNRVAAVGWQNATPGSEVLLQPDGSYKTLPSATLNVLQVLNALGNYQTFLQALKTTGLDQALNAANAPNYTAPVLPSSTVAITPQFPGGSPAPPRRRRPRPHRRPSRRPTRLASLLQGLTRWVFAPTDDAFNNLLVNLGGGQRLPIETLFQLPQLKEILTYHIVPGEYTPDYLRNNTPIYTAKGVEIVPFMDGCQTNGQLMLSDSCIDKPTPDNYTCAQQVLFDKCYFPFMTSALAAQWQGGFCQRTCGRCSCAPDSGIVCANVQEINALANNGVVYGISRVLFPPPVFTKEQALAQAAAANASGNATAAMPLGTAPPVGTAVGGIPPLTLTPPAAGAAPAAATPAAATPAAATPAAAAPAAATPAAATPAAATPAPGAPAASPAVPPAAGRRRLLLW